MLAPHGPFTTSYGVHFVSGYLLQRFLEFETPEAAIKNAVVNPERTPMTLWRDGGKIELPTTSTETTVVSA